MNPLLRKANIHGICKSANCVCSPKSLFLTNQSVIYRSWVTLCPRLEGAHKFGHWFCQLDPVDGPTRSQTQLHFAATAFTVRKDQIHTGDEEEEEEAAASKMQRKAERKEREEKQKEEHRKDTQCICIKQIALWINCSKSFLLCDLQSLHTTCLHHWSLSSSLPLSPVFAHMHTCVHSTFGRINEAKIATTTTRRTTTTKTKREREAVR